jgi:hypothetical protein
VTSEHGNNKDQQSGRSGEPEAETRVDSIESAHKKLQIFSNTSKLWHTTATMKRATLSFETAGSDQATEELGELARFWFRFIFGTDLSDVVIRRFGSGFILFVI